MCGRGRLASVLVAALFGSIGVASTAQAQVTAFSISADRDVPQLDGRSKSYAAAQGRFTTGPQPGPSAEEPNKPKQIAGAVEANAESRLYVVRVYLPAGQPLVLGRAYPVNGTLSSGGAGLDLTLVATGCGVTSGSFTVNEYSEQADGTPTAMDISFTGTCAYQQQMTATFTGRYQLNARGGGTPAPPAAPGPQDTVKPTVSRVRLTRRSFTTRLGTRLRFRLSEAARTSVAVERRATGRRVRGRCRRPTRENRGRPRCVRFPRVPGSIRAAGRAGENALPFRGRVGDRRLKPGRYRFVLSARDAAGNLSRPRRIPFRIR